MNKNRKLINAFLVSTMMLSGLAPVVSANEGSPIHRLGGNDRVETSVEVSKEVYQTAENVVIAGFKGEVDALTGTMLATSLDAPLLLATDFDSVKAELTRLGAKNVYLLGSHKVISNALEAKLNAANYNVVRVAGDDRYETSVKVAEQVGKKHDHVLLTNDGVVGGILADALSAGPVSGRDAKPVLLSRQGYLPETTKAAIAEFGVTKVTVVGGKNAVSEDIVEELKTKGITVNRVAGDDRYETAVAVAKEFFADSTKAIVANDGKSTYADALMGGYLGAEKGAPILLTPAATLNKSTANYLGKNATFAYILGLNSVVSEDVANEIKDILTPSEDTEDEELTVESVSAINPTTLLVMMSDGSAHEVVLENGQELVPGERTEVSFAIDGEYYEKFVIYVEKSADLEKEIEKARAEFKEAVNNFEEAAQVAIDAQLDLVQAKKYGTKEEILAAEEAFQLAEVKANQAGYRAGLAAEKLNDLINDTYVAIDYEKALAAVEKAERSNKKVDVTVARKLVNALDQSDVKRDLRARLNYVDQVIVAKEQVVFIEGLVAKEDFDVNAASKAYTTVLGFVEALEDGAVKTDLENRLEAVKTIIDDAVTSYYEKQATNEVVKAEENLNNLDYAGAKARHDSALKLVKALEAGEVRTDLEARLTEVEESVAADKAVTGVNKDSKQEKIDAAQELVTTLKDGKVKESLQERLDNLYVNIATQKVSDSEWLAANGRYEDALVAHNEALVLIEALEDEAIKTTLTTRLKVVEDKIVANAKAEARKVEVAIAGLPTAANVTLTNGTDVIATNKAYNALSDLAKGFVPAASKAKLDAVVVAYNAL